MRGCMPNFGDWGNYSQYTEFTFNATATGQHTVFTVTGDVALRLFAICKTAVVTVGGVGTCSLGIATDVAAIIPVTSGDALLANEIWHDASPDSPLENLSVARSLILSNGQDVTLDLLVAAFTSGVIRFYYTFKPFSNDGRVVPA